MIILIKSMFRGIIFIERYMWCGIINKYVFKIRSE